jgi:hypothetical protein
MKTKSPITIDAENAVRQVIANIGFVEKCLILNIDPIEKLQGFLDTYPYREADVNWTKQDIKDREDWMQGVENVIEELREAKKWNTK